MISAALVDTLLQDSGEGGLQGAISRCGVEMARIEVDDPGILHDADTPEDYRALLRYHNEQLVRPVLSVSLAREKVFFDNRAAILLRLIDETQSVRTACQRMQMSYSSGWNVIRTLESQLGRSLILRSQGGAGGGKSSLTEDGSLLLTRFDAYSEALREKAGELFDAYFEGLF
jgi:molybdate transport repressor ModE-like protein